MIKKIYFILCFCIYCSPGWSAPTYSVVYRADDRPLVNIQNARGMWPWRTGRPDNNLIHHFEGESLDDRSSNFVSTSASLRFAVEHAASLARPNSEEPFDPDFITYIYVIRPNAAFYDVETALRNGRDRAPENSIQRRRYERLIGDYTGMEEIVALGGFSENRILSYAMLTGEMLHIYGVEEGSPLFSEQFWAERWLANNHYNPSFNRDRSNSAIYTSVDNPRGYVDEVVNGTQLPVPLRFTCFGVNPSSSSQANEPACSSNQYLNIKRYIYNDELFNTLMNSLLHDF